jgi:hypothetical protein
MDDICFERDSFGYCHCNKITHPRLEIPQEPRYPQPRPAGHVDDAAAPEGD